MKDRNIDEFFKENLIMYQHLKAIRDNLWSEDGKSRVSVMVGAGFSLNASKIEENFKGMALWAELRAILTKKLTYHLDIEYKDVLEIGQIYEEEYGRASLDEILKEAIPDDNYEPGTLHYNFLNLPWTDIYTTNYDTLLERAKRQIYERKYQVIYDMKDIPNSTSPRIIKLHGSFPSNRPFIFTESDYNSYPVNFSPFVNMVQQSIMETTFVLLGFSGDDPNFEKWTTWVQENLGEQMPKIYMIGYGQKKRLGYLKSKGITLIDFQGLYDEEKDPYSKMFTDLFNFLAHKNREEKTKWPYKKYNKLNLKLADLKYNREHFPGWIVIPNNIRRTNAENIRFFGNEKICSIDSLEKQEDLAYINEILWCYKHFYIPLEHKVQKHLQKLIDKKSNSPSENVYKILWFLLNQARFDCAEEEFLKYKTLIEECELNKFQCNEIIYEEILLNLALNNIAEVKRKLDLWQVGEKEIEWGIKKAAILLKINVLVEPHEFLEGYLQAIRSLLAIQSDDYRLLSLESIALHLLGRINKERDYGYDRLRNLNLKNCNVNKEFEHMIISIKSYEYDLGTKETPGFDPGIGRISSKVGDYFKQELLDSYALLNVKELFGTDVMDNAQYELALKNLEILYPTYSLIKRIHCLKFEKVDNIFSREYVYQLQENKLEVIIEVLRDSLEQREYSIIGDDVALEIISRIYFALRQEVKLDVDSKIINFLNNEVSIRKNHNLKKVLERLFKRLMFDKNKLEQKVFCEKLFNLNFNKQWEADKGFDKHYFFEPVLIVFAEIKDIDGLTISENKILEMLDILKDSSDESLKEAALIRLTFLAETDSLPALYRKQYIEVLKTLPKNKEQGISEFIYNNVFDKIINGSAEVSSYGVEIFLSRDIPKFVGNEEKFEEIRYSLSTSLSDYFNEIYGVFPDLIGKGSKSVPANKYYRMWLDKFYEWWDDQENGLLRDINKKNSFLQIPDYLQKVVICLKNNILSVAPLEIFEDKDFKKLKAIFEKIDTNRSDLSLYLVPSFERLAIQNNYALDDIIDVLKSKNQLMIEQALNCIYDYLILIDNNEIEVDSEKIINELFTMLYYCTDVVLKSTIDTLKYSLKNIPSVFTEEDYFRMLKFVKNFLDLIINKEMTFNTLEDFGVISSMAGLVTYLSKMEVIDIDKDLKDWIKYIENYRLPEVRKYRDFLCLN